MGKITGPYEFPHYALPQEDIDAAKAVGLKIPRFMHNDGSVSIFGRDENGERKAIAIVPAQSPFKRGTGYQHVCEERDRIAQMIVDALNAADKP